MSDKETNETSAKPIKSSPLINALVIGFLLGIIIYSVVNNALGFLSIIPLYLIFKLWGKQDANSDS
jgi:riboflavin transporter FmnP